jgi:hypothetical protein
MRRAAATAPSVATWSADLAVCSAAGVLGREIADRTPQPVAVLPPNSAMRQRRAPYVHDSLGTGVLPVPARSQIGDLLDLAVLTDPVEKSKRR